MTSGLLNMFKTYRLFSWIIVLFIFLVSTGLFAQDPDSAIHRLREGYLIVRIPAFKNKIDTLESMIARSPEGPSKRRLSQLLNDAQEERDSTWSDYTGAFRDHYNFSKVAFVADSEIRNTETAKFYGVNGQRIDYAMIKSEAVYYLFFERTADSKVDALVIHDDRLRPLQRPFPNNFTRGGLGFLFVSLDGKPFAEWRVKRINKKLHKFYRYTRI